MESRVSRILIAGTGSGCGKTTVTCALLQAMVRRGHRTSAFKCGPDYIDPMFHSRIIGARSSNLDLHFFREDTVRYLLAKNGADRDISVIEGVMGFYDGMGLDSAFASSYHLARVTESPVILVVNARGASLSVLAVIQGFLSLFPDNGIRGVILNQCSAMTYPALAKAIRERFEGRVEPLGYLPKLDRCRLESRHLGLVTADEVKDLKEKLSVLADQAEKSLDLDGIEAMAKSAAPVRWEPMELPKGKPIRIGIAKDAAFCFYYEDSLNLLRELGAEIVEFSPLSDSALPENLQGLYFGGGYPELYAEKLSQNQEMLESVKSALERHIPCIAECGGFMYLTERIGEFPMVGALEGSCFDTEKLCRFGYVTLEAKHDNLLCRAGESIPAHEFHHWDCTQSGSGFCAKKASGKQWQAAISTETLYAGFPHFHFYANPNLAIRFCEACRKENRHD